MKVSFSVKMVISHVKMENYKGTTQLMLCTSALMAAGGHSVTMSICGDQHKQQYLVENSILERQLPVSISSPASSIVNCYCVNVREVYVHLLLIHAYSDASVIGVSGLTTPAILRYKFYCTGDEAHLTDCVVTGINSNICGNIGVGLMCETGNVLK